MLSCMFLRNIQACKKESRAGNEGRCDRGNWTGYSKAAPSPPYRPRRASMNYRREIDGLRAIAVLPVILYHAGFSVFQGGYVGVDVFFVISGFLITTIILNDLKQGRFSILRFYERRARRILPALFTVVASCLPFAWIWMTPVQMEKFSQSVLATFLFLSNIYFWRDSGYFAAAAGEKPLIHTWSLAVEEQFYLLFPLLLLLLWKRGARPGTFWISLLAIASLAFAQWGSVADPEKNFFFTGSRIWELMAGAIAASIMVKRPPAPKEGIAALGLAMIVFAIFAFNDTTPFPSAYTLAPVLGTVFILIFADKGTLTGRLLSLPFFVGIGLISYSAYLWHQPIFAFARIRSIAPPPQLEMLALALLSIVLAYLSWKFVEQPFRRTATGPLQSRNSVFLASGIGMALFLAFGVYGDKSNGIPDRLPAEVVSFYAANEWDGKCLYQMRDGQPDFPDERCIYNKGGQSKIAVWGDSIAASLTRSIARSLQSDNVEVHQITYGSCLPVRGVHRTGTKGKDPCIEFVGRASTFIRDSGFDAVIVVANWPVYLESPDALQQVGQASAAGFADTFRQSINRIGAPVLLLLPHPTSEYEVTDAAGRILLRDNKVPKLGISIQEFHDNTQRTRRLLEKAANAAGVQTLSMENLFCDTYQKGNCAFSDGKDVFLSDEVHFSPTGADIVAGAVYEKLAAMLDLSPRK